MKKAIRYALTVAMVVIGALLVSGNAGAVVVTPGATVVSPMPVATPMFGSVSASGIIAPRPFLGQPFVRPFPFFRPFGFPFFRPFFGFPFFDVDVDPFFFD